jgi:Uncharacterized ABC-type transport system, periplasmic component/surface lipoprotein
MSITEYEKAKRLGDRAFRADISKGIHPYLPVLDDILTKEEISGEVSLGLVDIPLARVIGTSTASRTNTFARNFMPIMDVKTEFGMKWSALCDSHLEEGIHDPIKVYEFMNYYYVVEGNKRVSVLKYFEADSISAFVTRKIPKLSDRKDVKIYYEYMDFYKKTGVNYIWFSNEGSFAKLINLVGIDNAPEDISVSSIASTADTSDGTGTVMRSEIGKVWNEDKTREFKSSYYRFEKAFKEQKGDKLLHITTGDAYLGLLELAGFEMLAGLSYDDTVKAIKSVWQEFLVMEEQFKVEVSLNPPEAKKSLISHILPASYSAAKPLKIAFIYDREPGLSDWLYAHELGRNHIKEVFGDRIVALKITTAATETEAIEAMSELIEKQGVEVIFTTTTRLIDASLKVAIKYKNIKILNCSLNTSHRYIRTYYARLYEVKFLSGVIAGIMTENDKVGYIADYPIFGNVANINAFALGAQMVNPNCKIYLKWTTVKDSGRIDDIYKALEKDEGVDMIADQDMITPKRASRRFGLYKVNSLEPINMAMTVYNWGVLYERLIDLIIHDSWESTDSDKEGTPINYWWGLSSGVVDLILSERLPMQVRRMVSTLKGLMTGNRFVAFAGGIVSQDGTMRNGPEEELLIDDIITMDWLCENVVGKIPSKDELRERARPIVEMKGVIKEDNEDTSVS